MKTIAVEEIEQSVAPAAAAAAVAAVSAAGVGARAEMRERLAAYYELTKPRITFLVVLTTSAGYLLGTSGAFNYGLFAHTLVGVALLCSGISALNQWMERDLDRLMRR